MNHIDDIINSENRPVMEERINPITESKSFQQLGIDLFYKPKKA